MIDDTEQVAGKWDENDESGRCHKCGPITVISSVIENSRACHHGITGHESHSTAIQPNGWMASIRLARLPIWGKLSAACAAAAAAAAAAIW